MGLSVIARYLYDRALYRWRGLVGTSLHRRGRPVPPHLHAQSWERIAQQMQQRYRPRRYSGRVEVLRSDWLSKYWDEPADLGWAAFADGDIETYQIATGHRLLASRDVRELAAYLSDCVHRAADAAAGPSDE